MAIQPQDFFNVAITCYELETEIGYRNYISRTYYAIYHLILNYLSDEEKNMMRTDTGHHSRLIQYLQSNPKNLAKDKQIKYKQLGYLLKHFRNYRSKADYSLNENITKNDADTIQEGYKKINNIINELKK